MPDNLDQGTDNQDQTNVTTSDNTTTTAPVSAAPVAFSWKSKVGEDLSKAPSLGKFSDTPEGLAEVAKSYVNLEKLLGHEKVPLPKGPEDVEGRAAFNKAIGVPDAPEKYNLPDASLPAGSESVAFDKGTFQQVMHKYGLTPQQAAGLWKEYGSMMGESYNKMTQNYSQQLDQNINALRKEWGDAYAANVELADMAISRLADSKEMGDWLTANIAKSPFGLKWAAKVGNLLAENKVGDFQYKRFSLSPAEAKNEIARIKADPNHPYNSEKATEDDHNAAVNHVNRLFAISMGKKPL